jgi:hypothetical protein
MKNRKGSAVGSLGKDGRMEGWKDGRVEGRVLEATTWGVDSPKPHIDQSLSIAGCLCCERGFTEAKY